ncbi:transporter substrate-binding domain-containing protein [Telmatospirillum sp.]|uniref:transporter substrate-binding domain-containing protein n=1 Tax=Telmatospirillum sp. TaxID=2079197 RepID=UPI00283BFA81|nr:transporter substrate-binding domain-containing protein [Telmatospirillum sp.]MDR3435048.1 transporter substrate-binding domain-containing protein [Telmatospirillum sp.]
MRLTWTVVLAAVVSTVALSSAGWAEDGALEAVKKAGVIRIGTTGDYLPYSIKGPDGKLVGADIEMGEDLAAALGVKAEFVPTTWKTLLDDFKGGRFDIVVGGVTITPERAEAGDFSIPLDHDGKRPIVRCTDKEKFASLAAIDQPSTRVVVNPGGTNERFAREQLKNAQLAVWPDNRTIFERIADGSADVMVTDGIEVTLQAVRHPGVLCPAAVNDSFTHFDKAYLLRRDPALKQAVDAWMGQALASGKWQHALDTAMH